MKLTLSQVRDDLKFLIELGGYYKVHDDNVITVDGCDTCVSVKSRLMKIIGPNLRTPEMGEKIAILNPFKHSQVYTDIESRFYNMISYVPSRLIYTFANKIIALITSGENLEPDLVEYLSKFKDIDEKMVKELNTLFTNNNKLKTASVLSIKFMNNRTTVRSKLLEELKGGKIKNIRKRTQTFVLQLLTEFLVPIKDLVCESTTIVVRRMNAYLGTLAKLYKRINPTLELLLSIEVDVDRIFKIRNNLEHYAVFTNHIMDISAAADEPNDTDEEDIEIEAEVVAEDKAEEKVDESVPLYKRLTLDKHQPAVDKSRIDSRSAALFNNTQQPQLQYTQYTQQATYAGAPAYNPVMPQPFGMTVPINASVPTYNVSQRSAPVMTRQALAMQPTTKTLY